MLMSGFRNFERDSRILRVDSIGGIAGCKDMFGKAGGILCPYDPLTPAQHAQILDFAQDLVRDRDSFDADDSIDPLYPETWEEIMGPYPPSLDILKDGLRLYYNEIAGVEATTASFRVNSTYPSWKHAHGEWAVVYPVSGTGPVGFDEQGKPYSTPLAHIFGIAPHFEHAAPSTLKPNELRVTIALSRPEV